MILSKTQKVKTVATQLLSFYLVKFSFSMLYRLNSAFSGLKRNQNKKIIANSTHIGHTTIRHNIL